MTRRVLYLFVLCALVAGAAFAGEDTVPAPEPVTGWLVASGLVGLGVRAFRKRRQ